MKQNILNTNVTAELLYEALETEKGGVQIYSTALRCAVDKDLKEEWNEYLEQTKNHVQILSRLLTALNLDVEAETSGRKIVRYIGTSLVKAMEMALRIGDLEAAQIVAAECVVLAETKDYQNWELIGRVAAETDTDDDQGMKAAYELVEDEEDEHLYHTAGWTRELWLQALGLPAVLPPPEERADVKTAIDAAKARKNRAQKANA